jgi:hypothetical protein
MTGSHLTMSSLPKSKTRTLLSGQPSRKASTVVSSIRCTSYTKVEGDVSRRNNC